VSTYCSRHGHKAPTGTPKDTTATCMDCGAEFIHEPDLTEVPPFSGDGKPNTKPSNPKDVIGSKKLSTSLVPTAVVRYAALAFLEGAAKYGKFNWRVAGVRMSIYIDAMERHLMKLREGEWADGDSLGPDPVTGERQGTGVPHLASAIACAGIILDANECGMLTDDRSPISAGAVDMLDNLAPKIAGHIRQMFIEYNPHQHVITDAIAQAQDGHEPV
jgi:hypothetical protein